MPLKRHNPAEIVKSFATYSQGVEVPPNARWLYVAGQVGVNVPDHGADGGETCCLRVVRHAERV